MQEVIAVKKKSLMIGFIVTFIAMLAVLSFVIYMSVTPDGWRTLGWMFYLVDALIFSVGIAIGVLCIVMIVRLCRLPDVIAERQGDELVFLGQRCKFSDILDVDYRHARGRYGMQSWGKLTVRIKDGRTFSSDFVADIAHVQDRLVRLMFEYSGKDAD